MENKIDLMNSEKNKKIEKIVFTFVIILACLFMLFYMSKKEGWHCDEIFSYGSSNCYYENTLHPYGEKDSTRIFLEKYVFNGDLKNNIKNLKYYYVDHWDEKDRIMSDLISKESPVWRNREDAKDYVIAGNNRFNYASVYYNQLRDVHPPLFYMLVHTVSSIFNNTFSKYIVFVVSLVFFVGTCIFIRKIMEVLDCKELSIPAVILYGFSMGAVSTMMFQRMYMMLTFFTIVSLYIHLSIYKNDFKITKKHFIGLIFVTVLGFLTQYYYCIYAAFIAIVMVILMIVQKKYKECFKYIGILVLSAIIGILIFPFAIQHIFFSYRGVSSFGNKNYIGRLGDFCNFIINGFSANNRIVYAIFGVTILANLIEKKNEKKKLIIIGVPAILYVLLVAKISPYIEIRYIMNILPIISIAFVMALGSIFQNKFYNTILATVAVVIIVGYGIIFNQPMFLYQGYQKYIDISEEYRNDNLVFVGYTFFNHIQSVPEFMNYKQTLMLSVDQLDLTKNDEVINNSEEFILIVNKYLGNKEVLEKVMLNTGFNNYEVLIGEDDTTEGIDNVVYRLYR